MLFEDLYLLCNLSFTTNTMVNLWFVSSCTWVVPFCNPSHIRKLSVHHDQSPGVPCVSNLSMETNYNGVPLHESQTNRLRFIFTPQIVCAVIINGISGYRGMESRLASLPPARTLVLVIAGKRVVKVWHRRRDRRDRAALCTFVCWHVYLYRMNRFHSPPDFSHVHLTP